jgi:hypothetical protein
VSNKEAEESLLMNKWMDDCENPEKDVTTIKIKKKIKSKLRKKCKYGEFRNTYS